MATYKDLLAQKAKLEEQLEAARPAEVESAVQQVRQIVQEYGLTAADLGLATKTKKLKGTVVPPKYMDPKTGVAWSGRGRAPAWIGLDWIGLDWIGLDWIGKNRDRLPSWSSEICFRAQPLSLCCIEKIALPLHMRLCRHAIDRAPASPITGNLQPLRAQNRFLRQFCACCCLLRPPPKNRPVFPPSASVLRALA